MERYNMVVNAYFKNHNLKDTFLVYSDSVCESNGCTAFEVKLPERDIFIALDGFGFVGEKIEANGQHWVVCEENHSNAEVLRRIFKFTAPVSVLKADRTIGTGDRLGIATPGHIRVISKYDVLPVFAQQSIRELNMTNRDFENVLDCVSWAVFRCGYKGGFGADGDHLKTAEEVEYALGCGYTMITLDCSEHIRNDIETMSDDEVEMAYDSDPALEAKYMDRSFDIDGTVISIDEMSYKRMSLIYNDAIAFAADIYNKYFNNSDLDFEVSIDETATPTAPEQHFYVASELIARGVKPATIAPRFSGEFQKGIDYIGDIAQFEKEFAAHARIAEYFGYKISVHSGSDKFSVFEIVGKYTKGRFHVKTAGTNWLEAMKVIAEHEPSLYREVHQYALDEAFAEAAKYYHVTTNLNNIPALDTLNDAELPGLFNNNDSRQLIHITYGLILNRKDDRGEYLFKDRLFHAWRKHSDEYINNLDIHIGHHLELLYKGFN